MLSQTVLRLTLDFRLRGRKTKIKLKKKKKGGFTMAGKHVQEKGAQNQCQSFVGHSDFAERVISAVRSVLRS